MKTHKKRQRLAFELAFHGLELTHHNALLRLQLRDALLAAAVAKSKRLRSSIAKSQIMGRNAHISPALRITLLVLRRHILIRIL